MGKRIVKVSVTMRRTSKPARSTSLRGFVYRRSRGYQLGEGSHIVFQFQVPQRQVIGVEELPQRGLEWKSQEQLALWTKKSPHRSQSAGAVRKARQAEIAGERVEGALRKVAFHDIGDKEGDVAKPLLAGLTSSQSQWRLPIRLCQPDRSPAPGSAPAPGLDSQCRRQHPAPASQCPAEGSEKR